MKKLLLLLTACCLAAGIQSSYAQASFGVKAGANIANVNFESNGLSFTPESLFGFYAGPFARLGVSSQFSIQPELLLSLQGYSIDIGDLLGEAGGDGKVNAQNLYLNLPVMARFSATEALHLEAGPQVGLLLNSKFKVDEGSIEVEESYKDLDFGLNIGAGYTLPLGLSIEARYNLGLANIGEGAEDSDGKATNRVFSFGLGYTF